MKKNKFSRKQEIILSEARRGNLRNTQREELGDVPDYKYAMFCDLGLDSWKNMEWRPRPEMRSAESLEARGLIRWVKDNEVDEDGTLVEGNQWVLTPLGEAYFDDPPVYRRHCLAQEVMES